jgi:signal transduction histidine kinase
LKYLKTTYTEKLPFHTLTSLRERLEWFISLRWIAVLCLLLSIPSGKEILKFHIGFNEIILLISLLAVINIVYTFLVNHFRFKNEYQELAFAEIQIIVDLIIISMIIHFSGGIGNPFYFLYIVQVILSAILFPGKVLPYVNAFFAAFLLTFWTIIEHLVLVDRYLLRTEPISVSLIITSLVAFYITNFAGIYIINNFMGGYRSLKRIIDEKNIQLEKSIKDRNKAFRYAAHELKSPVIAIQSTLGVVGSLYSDDLKSEIKEMIFKAERRSNQLLEMIKELILITQYNLGIEKPHYETVDFNDWLFNIVKLSSTDAKAKNISLEYEKLHEPIFITLDTNGLEKVATNILNNALRYTPEFGVIKVAVLKNADSFGFSISDTGIGIPKEDLLKIFDEFYRSKNAREAVQIGTGLGLNLVKEIVEQLGGDIEVESEFGKGSTFKVNIPIHPSTEELISKSEESLIATVLKE